MGFKDLNDFFDPTLPLPIRGKLYVVKSPDAGLGVRVQRLVALGMAAGAGATLSAEDLDSLELDDAEERDLYPRLLGDTYAEMIADGLPWEWVKHAGTTTLMWVGMGYEAAEAFWGAPGEHRRPTPQDHKAPARKTTTRKTSSTRTTSATAASPAGSTPPNEATTPA